MRFILLLVTFFSSFNLIAQSDSLSVETAQNTVQISILTCGVGEELYASFGHTGVRVKDSINGIDDVYNYGTFNFNDPDFYTKFTLGKLDYYLAKSSFRNFIVTYEDEHRTVDEQVLLLGKEEKEAIIAYLENNLKPENRAYRYDFLFDNCATRIRDIFTTVLGPRFMYGDVLGNQAGVSYRTVLNQYLINKHWERFGINLLLGSKVDSAMTNEGSMFLPDFLNKGIEGAGYKGQSFATANNPILRQKSNVQVHTFNGPFWAMTGILILVILAYHVNIFRYLKGTLNTLLLLLTGLLGFFMLFMWLGTEHQSCNDNYNILWAVPLNIIIAFVWHKPLKWLKMYALAGISLLIVALLVHAIGIQRMPLIELLPLFACMMYIYIDMYKRSAQLT
jgi:hypothetical protein